MDLPQLVQSRHIKVQLIDQGYLLCLNKSRGEKHYFRCTLNKPTQCKGTAVIKGILQDGMFDVLSHRVDAHHHEQSPCDFHLREFHSKFKNACREQVDTPVQQVYEDQKIAYATSLSEADRATFLTSLPPSKGSLMIGYRLVP